MWDCSENQRGGGEKPGDQECSYAVLGDRVVSTSGGKPGDHSIGLRDKTKKIGFNGIVQSIRDIPKLYTVVYT